MKNTDKNQPKQGQGKIKPRVRPAKVEQSEEERKQAEEALRESEEKYRSLVERANDGITIIQDGVVKFANTRLVEMWGCTVEEVLETPFANHIHPDQLPAMVERYQQRMAGEDIPPMYETVLLRSDGSKVYVEINAEVIAYLGKPADLVMVRDVTERKRAEEAVHLRAEELAALQATVLEIATPHDLPSLLHTIVERAARLLNANSSGMYLCDPAKDEVRCVVSYNTPRDYTGTVLKYGQGAAGIVAQTGKPLIIDDYRTWGKRADAFEKEQPFSAVLSVPMFWHGQVTGVIHVLHNVETRHFTEADLELLTLFANHAAIATENARLLQGLQRELAERKRAEELLQRERNQAQQYLDIAGVMMTALDSNGRIMLVNKKGCEILGYENEQELIGRDWFETCLPPHIKEDAKKVIDQLMAGDISPVEYHENPVLTKAGKECVIAFHNTVIRDAASNITGILFSGEDITERKRAEQALRESEEKYRTILENIEEGYFEVDIAGNFTFFNESVCRLLGYSREEMMGMNNRYYTNKTNAQKLYRTFNGVYRTGVPAQGSDWELIRKDGTKRYVECSVSSIKNKSGQPIGFRGIIRDITERKRTEAERQALLEILQGVAATESLQELLELIRQSLAKVIYAENFFVVFHNRSTGLFEEVFAVDKYDAPMSPSKLERSITSYVFRTGEPLLLTQAKFEELVARGEVELVGTKPAIWLGAPLKTPSETIGVIVVQNYEDPDCYSERDREFLASVGVQVSLAIERKQAEEALRASEERFAKSFHVNPIAICVSAFPDGRMVEVNEAFLRLTGYKREEVLGRSGPELDLWNDPEMRTSIIRELLESGSVRDIEGQLRAKSGHLRDILASAEIIQLSGQPHALTMLSDITERKQMADELRQRYTELALLYEAGLTINRELDPHLQLEKLFKTAMQALQADHAEFSRYDAAKGSVQFEMGIGYSPEALDKLRGLVVHDGEAQGLIGLIAQNRQPLNLPDVHADPRYVAVDPEIRSALWVPVARENQLLGVLGVLSTRPNAFSDQHERLLSLFANQAAVALENARLFEETSRRLEHVQALRTIDMTISSSLDLRVTFDVFLEQATRQLEVHAADILLLNLHTQMLEYTAGRGFRTAALQHTYLRLGESLAGRAALERRVVHVSDLASDPDGLARAPKLADEGFVAYFAVPLIAKGLVKGVFEIFHRAPLEADQEWLDFVETLAGQAAIAIDNVTLFDDLQRSNVDLTLAYDATIEGWSHALDLRDKETEGHTQHVADLTLRLAQVLGVSDHELIHIRRGALLHDIGKMGIPDEILRKPASLDEEEWATMRQHPVYAYEMLSPVGYLRPALDIPYCHHEKWDGSGYPRGLKGEQIPLAARIFAVVDVYDALTSDRPYRKAWSREKALAYIQQQAGLHFDPEIVSAFLGMPILYSK